MALHNTPNHVAVIMDGNRRWAKNNNLPIKDGHQAGVVAVKVLVKECIKYNIKYLSLFAFSTENVNRTVEEVQDLMNIFLIVLQNDIDELLAQGVAIKFIGNKEGLSADLRLWMEQAEVQTKDNNQLTLVIAIQYGGRWDIIEAVKKIYCGVQQAQIAVADITENIFAQCLATKEFPDPDLVIRTSGEQRISNYYLWQLQYSELYFTDTLWPDFSETSFQEALRFYNTRIRRYGLNE